jgi:hypothetical protein
MNTETSVNLTERDFTEQLRIVHSILEEAFAKVEMEYFKDSSLQGIDSVWQWSLSLLKAQLAMEHEMLKESGVEIDNGLEFNYPVPGYKGSMINDWDWRSCSMHSTSLVIASMSGPEGSYAVTRSWPTVIDNLGQGPVLQLELESTTLRSNLKAEYLGGRIRKFTQKESRSFGVGDHQTTTELNLH